MPSIFDRAVETSFKPTDHGFEFRCPSPWIIGGWRTYRVNAEQKERLAACLRQRQRLVLRLLAACLLGAAVFTALDAGAALDAAIEALFVALLVAALFAVGVGQHIYLMRRIEPVLAEVRRPGEHATLHEQIVGVAAAITPVPLTLGAVGGALIAAAGIKAIGLAIAEGRIGVDFVWSLLELAIGAALTGYFGYLAILKRRLRRRR